MPKTPAQALAALGEGLVDEGVFIWKAVNIHPVFEEPWDLNEVERLLAKSDLDLESTLLLMTIFERLIRRSDKEQALFAAESINSIERRRMGKIQSIRKLDKPSGEQVLRLVVELHELGLTCFARPVLKKFYLQEALSELTAFLAANPDLEALLACEFMILEIGILIDLPDLDRAEMRLRDASIAYPDNSSLHLLSGKIRFERRDYRGVACALQAGISSKIEGENKALEEIAAFWSVVGGCRD